MSKLTQIALDFGQEPQTPPPAPAPAANDGGGEALSRPYMTAGGVGVRIKAYKQTPTPQNGDLFGGLPPEEIPAGPGEPVAEETVQPGVSEDVAAAAAATLAEEQAAELERARIFEERVMASRERAGIYGEPAAPLEEPAASLEGPAIEQVAASEAEPVAAPEVEPETPQPVQDEEPAIVHTAEPALAKAAEPAITSNESAQAEIPTAVIAPATKRTPAAKRAAAAKRGPSKRGRKSLKQVAAEADLIEIPEDEVLFSKQYYTMGEVSEMFHVNQSLLRFWETEFDILQPRKNKKGDRYFRPVDIKHLHLIYHLLRQKKYTIEGAKEFLKNNKKAEERFEMIQRLQQVKAFLQEMKAQL